MPITPTNPFKGRQFPGEVIILCVRWYLRYRRAFSESSRFARSVTAGVMIPLPSPSPADILDCAMATTVSGFYDEFAGDYHLLFEDWEASMLRQASAIASILERECA